MKGEHAMNKYTNAALYAKEEICNLDACSDYFVVWRKYFL